MYAIARIMPHVTQRMVPVPAQRVTLERNVNVNVISVHSDWSAGNNVNAILRILLHVIAPMVNVSANRAGEV